MIHVAICQTGARPTKEENLACITAMIEEAVATKPNLDLVIFPEYAYYDPTDSEDSNRAAEPIPGPFTDAIAALAVKHKVNIIPGTIPSKAPSGKIQNACVFMNREGKILGRYNKVHLFDALGFKESDCVEPGTHRCVIDADFGRIGMMVCYDLRFPELARSMVLEGADILFVPAAFPGGNILPPRTDHWDILVQSAALTNVTYVVACNQYGPVNQEHFFGRSCVVDPWGTVTAAAAQRQEIVYAALDLEYQKDVRTRVGSWSNRRPDLYCLK